MILNQILFLANDQYTIGRPALGGYKDRPSYGLLARFSGVFLSIAHTNDCNCSMPSIEKCREIRLILIERGISQFHIFMGYAEGEGWMDIKQARWDEQRALAGK